MIPKRAILILGSASTGKTKLAFTIAKLFDSPLIAEREKFKNSNVKDEITGVTKETDLIIIEEVVDLNDYTDFLLHVNQFEVKGNWPAKINPSVIFTSNADLVVPENLKEFITVFHL